ncbi:serine/threonine-protein kinase [Ahniella affigens]|nr:serine/threonine-protein kinase [Ahniella affigens]
MTSLQDVFAAAVDLPLAEQESYLDALRARDPALCAAVEQLLRADHKLLHTKPKVATTGFASWAAALSGTSLRPGDQIGAFRILAPLAQGGMGVVFKAERSDGSVVQQVAIKLIRREFLDAQARQRFELERQTLATLDHPYIARLFDAAELPDGTPYFVMEYVDGEPINQYCDRHQLSVRARIELFRRVCQAVAHAHRNLIVHRDLKPGNILVGQDGLPKLLDFGIAKPLGGELRDDWAIQTGTANRYFSPRYAAPEQLRGGQIHVSSDVYALGVLLFELLTHSTPFDFSKLSYGQVERLVTEVAAPAPSAHVAGRDAAARTLRRQLQGDLDGIVLKCLRKVASERYESVSQFDDDLERWLQGMPVLARHGHTWYRFSKFAARNLVAVTTASASVLALALGAVMLWQQNQALRAERDRSQEALSVLEDAFAAADPIRTSGAEISARQILDSAEKRLDAIPNDQAGLMATLAESIAHVNLSLGRAASAANLYRRADRAAVVAEAEPGVRLRLMLGQSRALMNHDQLDEADQVLSRASQLVADPGPKWRALRGKLLASRGQADDGIILLRTALAEIQELGPEQEVANSIRFMLADALAVAEDWTGSLSVYQDTLRWQQQSLPADHPQITRTRLRMIGALRRAGLLQESLREAETIVQDVTRVFGHDSAEAAFVFNALGRSLEVVKQQDAALIAYENSLHASERALGPSHINTNRARFNLALALEAQGSRDADAEAQFKAAIRESERQPGQHQASNLYFRLYYAHFLVRQGRSADAFDVLTFSGGTEALEMSDEINRRAVLSVIAALPELQQCQETASTSASCERARAWLQRWPQK